MENCFDQIYAVVRRIPFGRVASYGQIARMLGNPRLSRIVGCALNAAPEDLPCHRVVNIAGRTAPGWSRQRTLLEEEGVTFKPNGRVDMERHLWHFSAYHDDSST